MKAIIKRINHFALAGVLALSAVLSTVVLPQSASALAGLGTEENPWQITTCTELQNIVNEWGEWEQYENDDAYVLANDIDCGAVAFQSLAFGEGGDPFSGIFDGAGHTISNLTISQPTLNEVGLFAHANNATVSNLTFANASVAGQNNVGVLAGISTDDTSIEDVRVTSSAVTAASAGYNKGGLVGSIYDSSVFNVVVDVTVFAPGSSSVGGLVGAASGSSFGQVAALGNVQGGNDVGGLVGVASDSEFDKAFATGDVFAASESGGLVGSTYGTQFIGTYARGDVAGVDYVGGHTGYAGSGTYIGWAYATGRIITPGGGGIGGGLVGAADGGATIDANTFWDIQTSELAISAGGGEVGKTTAEMKNVNTYIPFDWNFDDYWFQSDEVNDGYLCQIWYQVCYDAFMNGGGNSGGGEAGGVSIDGNVANLTTATGNTAVTLTVDDSCALSDVSALNSANLSVKDAAYKYSTGFVRFTASGCDGNATTVQLRYHGISPDGLTVRKHNPGNNAFFTITGANITKDGNDTLVSYTIIDNGDLDIDKTTGVITDPVGLGRLSVDVPGTGLGGGRR